jgi:hypothetical protein
MMKMKEKVFFFLLVLFFFLPLRFLRNQLFSFFCIMDNSSSIYKLWRTATRLPTTIVLPLLLLLFFSLHDVSISSRRGWRHLVWCGVVWWGREGAGQEGGGTRQGRDQRQQLEARSELLFLLLLLLAAPLRERERERRTPVSGAIKWACAT